MGIVFATVGLFLTFMFAIEVSLESRWLPGWLGRFAAYNSQVHCVAAFTAVIGLAALVIPKRRL